MYRFVRRLVPTMEKFSRWQKCLLQRRAIGDGPRCARAPSRGTTYTRDRRHLAAANLDIERLRLADDLGHLGASVATSTRRVLSTRPAGIVGGWRLADEAAKG